MSIPARDGVRNRRGYPYQKAIEAVNRNIYCKVEPLDYAVHGAGVSYKEQQERLKSGVLCNLVRVEVQTDAPPFGGLTIERGAQPKDVPSWCAMVNCSRKVPMWKLFQCVTSTA